MATDNNDGKVKTEKEANNKTGDKGTKAASKAKNLSGKAKDAVEKAKETAIQAIDANGNGQIDIEDIIIQSLKVPGIRIDRSSFLKKEFKRKYKKNVIDDAIVFNPAHAGISVEAIDAIADEVIKYERNAVSGISAALGMPGGCAMVATIPADITQYYGYMLRAAQKLLYLYGFPEPEDQDMFELLLTVSGVGPKSAIGVVEALRPSELAMAVLQGDIKKICTVKGLGKKSAERIVLELKDKLKGFDMSSVEDLGDSSVVISGPAQSELEDCISALVVLGYPASEANKAARSAYEDGLSVDELIRRSLRLLAK